MYEPHADGCYPLTCSYVEAFIPAQPGVFTLAIRLASGAHHDFFSGQSEDLQAFLLRVIGREEPTLPEHIRVYLDRFQCYVSAFVLEGRVPASEVAKMLQGTNDPIARLTILTSN